MFFLLDTSLLPSIILVGHAIYSNPWSHFPRKTNEYIIYVIKKGELYIQEEDNKYILKAGDLLLLEPDKQHIGYKKSFCDYYYVHFKHPQITSVIDISTVDILKDMISKRKQSLSSYGLSENPPTDSICYMPKHYHIENINTYLPLLNETISEYQRKYEHYKEQISCRILDFFIKLSRDFVTTRTENSELHIRKTFIKVQSILNFLNKDYYKKITSIEIEQTFESSYDYLNRIFHQTTGFTISHYLNMVRINKAKEIIESTSLKFSEIGYLVGIDNPYYFSKLFKKFSGLTPTQYWEMTNKANT